jgi:hypothetical protein
MCPTSSDPDTHSFEFTILKNGEETAVHKHLVLSFVG